MTTNFSDICKWYFDGPTGETIFSEPFNADILLQNDEKVDAMLRKQFKATDDRSFVLISAMISEQYVEDLLSMLLPDFDDVSEGAFMAAQSKIRLLSAFRIIPKGLTQAASHVQAVRNAFAHKLDVETYADLDRRLIDKMKGLYISRGIKTDAGPDDLKNLFWTMSYMATICLYKYRFAITEYVRITQSSVFADQVRKDYDAGQRLLINALFSKLNSSGSAA